VGRAPGRRRLLAPTASQVDENLRGHVVQHVLPAREHALGSRTRRHDLGKAELARALEELAIAVHEGQREDRCGIGLQSAPEIVAGLGVRREDPVGTAGRRRDRAPPLVEARGAAAAHSDRASPNRAATRMARGPSAATTNGSLGRCSQPGARRAFSAS
jgi:hypothetical protein